ncbi:hypothetical protein ATZ33_14215 [Enterococcus silesiacus]|uniref:Uncharacterized protein n=1 Tax=Enterococcus silesiacus TaxID=332949 RepID=A0A0S3KDW5_9ENTE|nr:hypothetical protein [Enterococcus silesiacus]ALS02491.1 hypothetical protein ATZ33_14215 [Enterococcus silesiacus]OJG93599.1 hypothetical protein RV15_GL000201 [Enterococcus silesiacus]
MENIDEFIAEWQDSSNEVYSDHIDFFINKTTFDYKDCLMVMKEMRKKLNAQGFDKIKIMIKIQCGQSKKVQIWGENFWDLVDATLTPPELFIGGKFPKDSWSNCHKINHSNQIEGIENYIVSYPVEDGFIRCLNLVENEVSYV